MRKQEGFHKWILFKKNEITPMEALASIQKKYKISDFSLQEADIEETAKEIYEKSGLK